jgi:hypothetical protein
MQALSAMFFLRINERDSVLDKECVRAIAQAVSHRAGSGSSPSQINWEFWRTKWQSDKVTVGHVSSRVFLFPLPNPISPTAPYSSLIVRGWYNKPISCRGTEWTLCHATPRLKETNHECVESVELKSNHRRRAKIIPVVKVVCFRCNVEVA